MIFCVAEKSFLIDLVWLWKRFIFQYRIEMAEEIKSLECFRLDYHLDFT